jgi:hypothetical protein
MKNTLCLITIVAILGIAGAMDYADELKKEVANGYQATPERYQAAK